MAVIDPLRSPAYAISWADFVKGCAIGGNVADVRQLGSRNLYYPKLWYSKKIARMWPPYLDVTNQSIATVNKS